MSTEEGLEALLDSAGELSEAADALDEIPDELPEGGKPGCLTRLLPVTTPGCATWLTAIFLVITVATVWGFFLLDPDHVPWRHSLSWPRIALLVMLVILIPIVVNRFLKLWLEGSPSPFPDLDYAWDEGLHALASNGLSIQSLPIYLVLGSRSEQQERAIMNAAGLRLRVAGVPEGSSALHWYANSEAIYLFCSDCAWSSALASLREELAAEATARGIGDGDGYTGRFEINDVQASMPMPPPPPAPTNPPYPTSNYQNPGYSSTPSQPPSYAAPPPPTFTPQRGNTSEPIRGTIMLDQYMPQPSAPSEERRLTDNSSRSGNSRDRDDPTRGTLSLDDPRGMERSRAANNPPPSPPPSTYAAPPPEPERTSSFTVSRAENVTHEPVLVAPQYSSASLQELQYLGQKLRRARQAICPINGILTLIQFESIHSTPAELEELQKAIRSDLSTIQYAFALRAPVTAMIVGLEKERGFRELVRRVGRERAAGQRFGRKFDVEAIPTEQEMRALTSHVCGAFEDWAYTLFREEQSLSRPGNTRLYELLSRVRCSWKDRLAEILVGGFGCEAGKGAATDSVLFSGCYFAATGDTPDRQAFVKGVIDKLADEQEMIEWTRDATRSDRRQSRLSILGAVLCVVLLLTLLIMVVWHRFA